MNADKRRFLSEASGVISFDSMVPPEVALERLIQQGRSRGEKKFQFITGRVAVENLVPDHVYRWLVDWMNAQLSDIGVNSTGGRPLPPIHFDLVHTTTDIEGAHVFESEGLAFIIVTKAFVDEMLRLSEALVEQERGFMAAQISLAASPREIVQLLLLMQFCLVTAHEYSHLVRGHWDDDQPLEIGETLCQAQELDADGFGIHHDLEYFFRGRGRAIAAQWLRLSSEKALENSILDCFLLSMMLQLCARWAGIEKIDCEAGAEHPPHPLRMEYSTLFIEMWCREVGRMPTAWMTDGTWERYFHAVANLFPAEDKTFWNPLVSWLRSSPSEQYRVQLRRSFERIRTGGGNG